MKCTFLGCSSKGTFARRHNLNRHMKKHERKQVFPCPAVNCKFRGEKAFYRIDKLVAHIETGHHDEDVFSCPIAGCSPASGPMNLRLFNLHIFNHNCESFGSLKGPSAQFRSLSHCFAERRQEFSCPIKNCSKSPSLGSFRDHILRHSEGERADFQSTVARYGFDSITGNHICPLDECKMQFPDPETLHYHLTQHLRGWTTGTAFDNEHAICPTTKQDRWEGNTKSFNIWRADDPRCSCRPAMQWWATPQLRQELRSCCERLIYSFPCLYFTSIFDDFMPTIHRFAQRRFSEY